MNAEIANTEVKQEVKSLAHRNAYQLKLAREYNAGKSPRHPNGMKMYAELTRNKKRKNLGIKSLRDNNLKAGFQNLMFNGTPFIVSPKCPASHIFMLNEEFLALYYHPQRDFVFDPFLRVTNQDMKSGKVFWMGNLGSSNSRMHGKFTAVAA